MNILDNIKENLMQGLNANDLGLHFFITTEIGSYKKPDRVGNQIIDYINGQLTVINSSTLPTQGLEVSTQTIQLSLAIPLRTTVSNESVIVKNVRTVLEQYLSQNRVIVIEQNSKSLVCALNYSLPNTGSVDQRSGIGTFLELTAMLYVSCIENGLNSMNCKILIDGESILYSSCTLSRVVIPDNATKSNSNGLAVNTIKSSSFGIDMNVIALNSESSLSSKLIMDYLLLGNANTVFNVKIIINAINYNFSMLVGECDLSLEGIKNGNFKLALIPADTDIIDYMNENGGKSNDANI